ncbi:hypothetical protein HYDPIDRAFT_102602, partial [Hydnomerulius pinastri MD-312]
GYRAAQVLAAGLPSGWRVVLVDRNSHFNHVYNLPRYAVLPGHEHKAFIPYHNLFNIPSTSNFTSSSALHGHICIHGTITSLHPHHITYIPHSATPPLAPSPTTTPPLESSISNQPHEEHEQTLHFDYAIYALGSHLPAPIDLWGFQEQDRDVVPPPFPRAISKAPPQAPYTGTKREGISWLRVRQRRIKEARSVVVVGGGALGIQFASDIAALYPRKCVTLLHSRMQLLPRFDPGLGDEVFQGLQELGVRIVLGERLDMSSLHNPKEGTIGTRVIRTTKGRVIEGDLVVLCTGQTPNTSLLRAMDPRTIDPETGLVRVLRSMQVSVRPSPEAEAEAEGSGSEPETPYPHLFAIGDAADAFGAINAGHTAYYQGEVAGRNLIRLLRREARARDLELEEYTPGLPMIKVSLGMTKSAYEVAGVVGTKDDGTEDLGAAAMWAAYGYRDVESDGLCADGSEGEGGMWR